MHSDKVSRNNGKDWRYIVGYQADRETTHRFLSRNRRAYLAAAYHNTAKTQLVQCHSIFLRLELE